MTQTLDVVFTDNRSAEERVTLEYSENCSILAQNPVMNSLASSRADTLEALRMRENMVKDPMPRHPGLECHAQSEEMLISHHLCYKTQEKRQL